MSTSVSPWRWIYFGIKPRAFGKVAALAGGAFFAAVVPECAPNVGAADIPRLLYMDDRARLVPIPDAPPPTLLLLLLGGMPLEAVIPALLPLPEDPSAAALRRVILSSRCFIMLA